MGDCYLGKFGCMGIGDSPVGLGCRELVGGVDYGEVVLVPG